MTLQYAESQIRHVLIEFQIDDMKKAMTNAKANFLVALGLMTATEYLGGLVTSLLGLKGKSRQRFEAGFTYLGPSYQSIMTQNKRSVLDIYENVRCGLVHQYLPPQTSGVIAGHTGGPGIVGRSGQLVIMVDDYLYDLEQAANRLLNDIKSNSTLLQNCNKALSRVPRLR